jgi:hypothetical protein
MVFCSFALSDFRRLKIGVAGKSLRAIKSIRFNDNCIFINNSIFSIASLGNGE